MLALLSPSKTQEGRGLIHGARFSLPPLLEKSEQLIYLLRKKSVTELGDLMKMSERLAYQTRERIHSFCLPFSPTNATPAIATFQGDVYTHITSQNYGPEQIEYLQGHLCILSGLYGILRPLDLMQPYRLEMGCRLPNPEGKSLYEFWGKQITAVLCELLSSHSEPIVVNLASAEYSRAINKKLLGASVLDVEFKERKGDGYRIVAIHAKRARGMMVDFMVRHGLQRALELTEFAEAGYRFRKELSTPDRYCFTRETAVL